MRRMETTDSINNIEDPWIFPLNVYATLMNTLVHHAPWLVYGEFSDKAFDALQLSGETHSASQLADALVCAQQKRVDRLLAAVRGHMGARVLEVGCGQGALVDVLHARGFDASGIDVNAGLLASGPANKAPADSLICCAFENYCNDVGFDVLIFHGSARYVMPLTLFDKALELLKPGGQLLICDEFIVCRDDVPDPQPLAVMDHVLALAKRTGFDCLHCDDLSADTNRFQQVLVGLLQRLQGDLPWLTGESETTIRQLLADLQNETIASANGSRKHVLLSLRAPETGADNKNHQPGTLRLRNAAALPPESYRQVFETSFSAPFDPELWAWKYHSGRGASVVAERDGQAVAHYGGVVRQIVYFSHDHAAVQICDVMVLPQERGFFSRNSLFFKTAASMLEQHAGYKAASLLGFGFPNLKAMHVAQRLGLYDKTDELMQIALAQQPPDTPRPQEQLSLEGRRVCEVEFDDTLQTQTDYLWQQMKSGFADAIIGVRDRSYLCYRFLQRPGLHYQCLTVMQGDQLLAVAFTRDHGDRRLLMDIIAAPQHLECALLSILQSAASDKPCHFWLTAGQLARVISQSDKYSVTATGIQIPCNRWSPGPATDRLVNAWWLTAGDMDFL